MEEKESKMEPQEKKIPSQIAAAIAIAVILHRAGPGNFIPLMGGGLLDEGAWGRASRAGMPGAFSHRLRRD